MTAPAYAAGPITLDEPLYACIHYRDWDRFEKIILNKDQAGAAQFIRENQAHGHIPADSKIYSDRMIDGAECIRIQGTTDCFCSNAVVFVKTGQEP
jgi:hypothetical protein